MLYARTREAEFVSRENRFVATVLVDGEEVRVHVKNTGRCGEILLPGTRVVLSESDNPGRRYRYDLVAAWKGDLLDQHRLPGAEQGLLRISLRDGAVRSGSGRPP